MNHTKRGLALIFNHELFASDYMDPRHGTNVDCDALMTSLTQLGFSVRDYQNLNFKAITTVLAEGKERYNYCLIFSSNISEINPM